MPKPFLTFDAQISYLENDKNLVIQDHDYAKTMLKQIGYFSLIGGYKAPFKNTTTRKYKDGTRFEDIVALYYFDENLRELFLKYICFLCMLWRWTRRIGVQHLYREIQKATQSRLLVKSKVSERKASSTSGYRTEALLPYPTACRSTSRTAAGSGSTLTTDCLWRRALTERPTPTHRQRSRQRWQMGSCSLSNTAASPFLCPCWIPLRRIR